MPYYPAVTNATNTTGAMFEYIRNGMEAMVPGLGGNTIGLLLIVPLWTIIFMLLVRNRPTVAFTGASFIVWLISIPLIVLGYLTSAAFGILFVMWVGGGVITFYTDR